MSQPPPPGPTTQPSEPGEPPAGPPPGRRSKGALVTLIVAAVAVIGGGVIALILFLGGDDDSLPSTSSPLDTAESFEQAWNLTDTRTLKSLMTDDLRPFADFDQFGMEQIDLENPEVVDESSTEAVAVLNGGDNTTSCTWSSRRASG